MSPRLQNAFLGSLVADALAMPVHWYYDVAALDRDYPRLTSYEAPRSPHSESFLWRYQYKPRNAKADILHDQAVYWGKPGIHYHQFLSRGENTLNFRLAVELYRLVVQSGAYDADRWLDRYIELMQTRGWHRDTYVEEYHRRFFQNFASGRSPRKCGVDDIHIGGLASVPALVAGMDAISVCQVGAIEEKIREHVGLTHDSLVTDQAALGHTRILRGLADGQGLREAISQHGSHWVGESTLRECEGLHDRQIIGKRFSPACYLPDSFSAALALSWKYHKSFDKGIIANALCGGDNCHRGAVVGSLLGAANGIPECWLRELVSMEQLRCDQGGNL